MLPGGIAAVAGVITAAFSAPFLRGEKLEFQTAANRLWFIEVIFLHTANVVTAGITYEDSDPADRGLKVIRGIDDPFADLYLLAVGFGLWIGNVVLIEQGCTTEPRMSTYQAIQRSLAPLPVFFAWSRRLFEVAPLSTALFLGVVDLMVPAAAGAFGVLNAFAPKSADDPPALPSPAPLVPALST